MFDSLAVFEHVRKYREMYIQLGFEPLEGFFVGFDLGNAGGVLRGFREWLEMQANRQVDDRRWSTLVIELAFPDTDDREVALRSSAESEETACLRLFELFNAFHHDVEASGLKQIYLDHHKWLDRQSLALRSQPPAVWPAPAEGIVSRPPSGRPGVIASTYLQMFARVRDHREHYIGGSYDALEGLFRGFDVAHGWAVFLGFGEWLAMRLGFGSELAWALQALYLAFPDADRPREVLGRSPETQDKASRTLFDLIEEFVRHRDAVGLKRIYQDHWKWLATRGLHGADQDD